MSRNKPPFARRAALLVDALKQRREDIDAKAASRRAHHDAAVAARIVRETDAGWRSRRKRRSGR